MGRFLVKHHPRLALIFGILVLLVIFATEILMIVWIIRAIMK
jgi:hypothetical protein